MSDATSFDVVPTEDGAGYWVKICSEERCCQAFVSVSYTHLTLPTT